MAIMRKKKGVPGGLRMSREISRRTSLFLSIVFLLFFSRGVSALTVPEKLVFDLTWTGLKAGTSTLETISDNGRTKIISTARSADWVSLFYTVDDRV
jgi:hypothetical protein